MGQTKEQRENMQRIVDWFAGEGEFADGGPETIWEFEEVERKRWDEQLRRKREKR
jgi:hypothetical protein